MQKEMLKSTFQNLRSKHGFHDEFSQLKVDTSNTQGKKVDYSSPTSVASRRSTDIHDDHSCCSSTVSESGDGVSLIAVEELDSSSRDDYLSHKSYSEWRPKSPSDEMYISPQKVLRRKYQQQYLMESGFKQI